MTSASTSLAAQVAMSRASAKIEDAVKNNMVADYWGDIRHDKKSKCLYLTSAVFFAIFLGICFSQLLFFTREASRSRESFVVFSDGDVDDLLALNYLFRRSDVGVPLIVVSGNGLASPLSAFKIVKNFVVASAKTSKVAATTRVVLGASMSKRDAVKAFFQKEQQGETSVDPSLYCSYSRFSRSSLAVSVATDSLYGQSEILAKLASTSSSSSSSSSATYKQAKSLNMFQEFGKVLQGAMQTGTKITLLSMSPLTDMSSLLDALPSSTITSSIKLLIVSGGRFATTSNSGVSDAALFTRDNSRRGSYGSYAELNFFLDPEAAQNVLGPESRYTSTLLPSVIIPVDVAGSISAYVDFHDLWVKMSSSVVNQNDPINAFLAKTLRSFSTFEGSTFFPYKGTPKSIAAVAVALDRRVRNQVVAMKDYVGVMTWETATNLHLETSVGRSGKVAAPTDTSSSTSSASSENLGVGRPDILVGFAGGDSSSSGGSSTITSSRVFLDSYFSSIALPWP